MSEILRRRYKVRPVTRLYKQVRCTYKQVMLPVQCKLQPGQEVTVIHAEDWALIVPAGTKVDEIMLEKAIGAKE